jgi:beta-lactamase regulating signal transducer with metallopeptidase domain
MTNLPVVLVWGLKATPLLLGAWLATALLRRASAATRHFVWVLAVAGVLALPVLAPVAPRVAVPVPASWATPLLEPPSTASGTEAEPTPARTPATVAAAAGTTATAETAATAEATGSAGLVTRVWAIGALLMTALLGISIWRTARVARRARPVANVAVLREARSLAARLGVRRPVRVLQAADEAMPMTWGLVRPSVLVPASFGAWPPSRRQAVLVHELSHVRRWDWATQFAARVACALYWWNPLAWVAARRLREERELACDDLVLAQGTVAATYAGDLLEIARRFRATPATALVGVAMARRSELADRLLAVLDAARPRRALARGPALSAVAAAAALFLPVAGLATGVAPLGFEPFPPLAAAPPDAAVVWHPAPAPRAGRAVQSRTALLCDWSARTGSSSSSSHSDDDRLMIQIGRDDCTLTVRAQGELTFADDDRDLTRIARAGYFEIEERTGRTRRRVEISEEGGGLARRWFVDGTERPYEADARAWLGDALLVLMRRAGINAEARATRILSTRGEDALIAEIAELQSDHVAGRYYRVLFERGRLDTGRLTRLLDDAADRIDSDHELGRVLATVAARGSMDAQVQQAYVRAAGSLDSDHEQSQALQALVASGPLDAEAMDAILTSAAGIDSDFNRARVLLLVGERYPSGRPLPAAYLDAVTGMESDHERGRVLAQLLERDRLPPPDRARVLGVVSRIDSDHSRSQVLTSVAAQGPLDDVTREAFFAAVRDMESDHSRQLVLTAVLARSAGDATLLAVLEAARGIDSDHSKAQVLTAVAAQRPLSDRVRAAYVAVAGTISSRSSRDRALRAAGLQGT